MPVRETATSLARLVEGLLYQSETDAPWRAFDCPDVTGEPTLAKVRLIGHHKPGSPAAQQTVDAFFAPLVQEQDWFGDEEKAIAARYRSLWEAVKKLLRGATVFEIGNRQQAVYVVGAANEGGWAGVKTTAVQT